MNEIKKLLFSSWIGRYLFKTGIVIHLSILALAWFPSIVLQEPLKFFIERVTNYLYYSGGSARQRYLGKTLLENFPINNWSEPDINQLSNIRSLDQWVGQGASKNIEYTLQQYDDEIPKQPVLGAFKSTVGHLKLIDNVTDFLKAIKYAKPGDTIQLMPGDYHLKKKRIGISVAGFSTAPITVRASKLGLVKIYFHTWEGFIVTAPYWVFENLEIQGRTKGGEHAFHVVGKGSSFVLRNNKISNFNAIIKVNGLKHGDKYYYPDYGLIEKNTFFNTTTRRAKSPVNLLNINSVNKWVVRSNFISDFSKGYGNYRVSFGAYMKGNSTKGLFENNLVICENILLSNTEQRIGLSFGGGGTDKQYCRDQVCDAEHTQGVMRNNIILNCSHDVGIYLNKSKETEIYNNLIFNSLGIDVRFGSSSATIYNNIISGRIKSRDGGLYIEENNLIDQDCLATDRFFSGCSFLNFYWDIVNSNTLLKNGSDILGKGIAAPFKKDFCGNAISADNLDIGPIQYSNNLECMANKFKF
mgnify:CR=1 FL=1